jgi:hypothetical protein
MTAASPADRGIAVQAYCDDAALHALLARNLKHAGLAESVALHVGTPSRAALAVPAAARRLVVHLGARPLPLVESSLAGWAKRPVAIAWAVAAGDASTQATLEARGFPSFALGMRDGAMELVPLAAAPGAEYAFALSDAFVASLEGA